eukprot:TRINITY_DN2365_c0_g1_i7.p1 TRINITY_DN2365_c0_g1~~TRINITY_DN2365_c0_g1_i7.p1  ORF type:complete len:370 (+),score=75.57 TRINITY_DN2365_c0_g1_i7:88-1197(+)
MNKGKILLILVLGFVSAQYGVCPVYLPGEILPNTTCVLKVDDELEVVYYLKKCEPHHVCNLDKSDKLHYGNCTAKYTYVNKYPGEYCTQHDNCSYSNCTNNKCPGKLKGEKCIPKKYECNPGLFCDTVRKVCTEVVKIGEECKSDKECEAAAVCENHKCVKQASLSIGDKAFNPLACKTLYQEGGKCDKGPTLIRASKNESKVAAMDCPESRKCRYLKSDGKSEIEKDCVCALGTVNTSICPPGHGDFDVEDYLKYAASHTKTKCNSPDRMFCRDKPIARMGKDYFKAYMVYQNITNFNRTHNNTFYTKYLLTYDYWFSKTHTVYVEKSEISYVLLAGTGIAVVVIDIMLLFLYFRKLKSDAEIIDRMH